MDDERLIPPVLYQTGLAERNHRVRREPLPGAHAPQGARSSNGSVPRGPFLRVVGPPLRTQERRRLLDRSAGPGDTALLRGFGALGQRLLEPVQSQVGQLFGDDLEAAADVVELL